MTSNSRASVARSPSSGSGRSHGGASPSTRRWYRVGRVCAGHGEQRPFGGARAQQDPVDAEARELGLRRRLLGGGQDPIGRGEPGLGPVVRDRQHAVRGPIQELGAIVGIGEQRPRRRGGAIEHRGQPIDRAGAARALDLLLRQSRGEQQRPEQAGEDDQRPQQDNRRRPRCASAGRAPRRWRRRTARPGTPRCSSPSAPGRRRAAGTRAARARPSPRSARRRRCSGAAAPRGTAPRTGRCRSP